jgi:hypothetical protein
MKAKEFTTITVLVVALHVAAVSLAFEPIRWQYLLAAVLTAAVIWSLLPRLDSRRRWIGFLVGVALALAVQQVSSRLWRSQFNSVWPPLVQFAALHVLIGFSLDRLRRQRRLRTYCGTLAAGLMRPAIQSLMRCYENGQPLANASTRPVGPD